MKFETVWQGNFPAYWDVTPWMTLTDNHLVVNYRESGRQKRRILEIIDLLQNKSHKEDSVYNAILGSIESNVYLARIVDARSHIQVNRITNYDIITLSIKWTSKNSFLVEKFKIPQVTSSDRYNFVLSGSNIDLCTGEHSKITKDRQASGWQLNHSLTLEQNGDKLLCISPVEYVVWKREKWLASWFMGTKGDSSYFLLPTRFLVVLNTCTGEETGRFHLEELRTVTNHARGDFEFHNKRSFGSSTFADVLINKDLIAWVTNENRLIIMNTATKEHAISEYKGEIDLALVAMNDNYIVVLGIDDAEHGELLVVRMGEVRWNKQL